MTEYQITTEDCSRTLAVVQQSNARLAQRSVHSVNEAA
jgi:hypothetical protein